MERPGSIHEQGAASAAHKVRFIPTLDLASGHPKPPPAASGSIQVSAEPVANCNARLPAIQVVQLND